MKTSYVIPAQASRVIPAKAGIQGRVIPAQAAVQEFIAVARQFLDSRLRGNDTGGRLSGSDTNAGGFLLARE